MSVKVRYSLPSICMLNDFFNAPLKMLLLFKQCRIGAGTGQKRLPVPPPPIKSQSSERSSNTAGSTTTALTITSELSDDSHLKCQHLSPRTALESIDTLSKAAAKRRKRWWNGIRRPKKERFFLTSQRKNTTNHGIYEGECGPSVEGSAPSPEQDDSYAHGQNCIVEPNKHDADNAIDKEKEYREENGRLRSQLKEVELATHSILLRSRKCCDENKTLRRQLKQVKASTAAYHEENERLLDELDRASALSKGLLDELNKAKSQSDMIPFYDTRVNELLEELREKDIEVSCLKEEIGELRGYYRAQLTDLMLWDDDVVGTEIGV